MSHKNSDTPQVVRELSCKLIVLQILSSVANKSSYQVPSPISCNIKIAFTRLKIALAFVVYPECSRISNQNSDLDMWSRLALLGPLHYERHITSTAYTGLYASQHCIKIFFVSWHENKASKDTLLISGFHSGNILLYYILQQTDTFLWRPMIDDQNLRQWFSHQVTLISAR